MNTWSGRGGKAQLSPTLGCGSVNTYDNVARLPSTTLKRSAQSTINSHSYQLNQASQRTQQVFTAGNYVNYAYDGMGQLQSARGKESGGTTNRLHEQLDYAYDPAGNLNYRTNNALIQTFNVNSLNELTTASRSGTMTVEGTTTSAATNVTVNTSNAILYADYTFTSTNQSLANGTNTFTAVAKDSYGRVDTNVSISYLPSSISFSYDQNGNLTNDGRRVFFYDDENQLVSVIVTNGVGSSTRSYFAYDGKMRRRIRTECAWNASTWVTNQIVRYVYDGNLVIQERDANNLPLVSYTRGRDLSGSLEGAGGIGGLLARTDNGLLTTDHGTAHAYYHADGNGNITCLINAKQVIVAHYLYDPYGNILSQSGPLSDANLYRFSSKEIHVASGLVYYLYRFYDGGLQRWLNRDPLGEPGFEAIRSANRIVNAEAVVHLPSPARVTTAMGAIESANLYTFVKNHPTGMFDPLGLRHWYYLWQAGKLCTSKSCSNTCPVKYLDEDDWSKGFLNAPAPGKCASADAVATPGLYLKIPDNCRVTVECYTEDSWWHNEPPRKGTIKELRVTCYGLLMPTVGPAPVPPFPPSPYQ